MKINEEIKNKLGIYLIENKINGKNYIGSAARKFSYRYNEHKFKLKNNKYKNHLQESWNRYGEENFEFKALQILDKNDLPYIYEIETAWIRYYDSTNPDKGYNFCKIGGGTLGLKFKLREDQIRKGKDHPRYGKPLSESAKDKIRKKCSEKAKKININDCIKIKNLLIKYEKENIIVSKKINKVYSEIGKIISERVIASIRDGKHWSSKELGGGIKNWLRR